VIVDSLTQTLTVDANAQIGHNYIKGLTFEYLLMYRWVFPTSGHPENMVINVYKYNLLFHKYPKVNEHDCT